MMSDKLIEARCGFPVAEDGHSLRQGVSLLSLGIPGATMADR